MRSLYTSALSVLLLGGALAAPALAQGPQVAPPQGPQVSPYAPQPGMTTQGTSNVVAVPAFQPPPIVNVNSVNPNYGFFPSSPAGSYLSGKADLVNASGQYGIQVQQANLLQEDVHRSMLDSRRAVQNEARYERETTMNSEQARIQGQIDALRRARNEPPLNEIWSGQSLNALFTDIKRGHTFGVRGPAVPINQDWLKHINLTTGVTATGPGVLKDGPKLRWPSVLQNSNFDDDRKKIEASVTQALQQAMGGPVSLDLISDVRSTLEGMQGTLKSLVKDVPPGPYIDGKKYLRELDSSFSALKDPNVSNFFNGTWKAQGANVYELTMYMANNGLQFAPAVSGDQSFYTALYQALLTYDVQMAQTVAR